MQTVSIPRFGDARDWCFTHPFGLFVHWGLYALDGWHEQAQWRQRIARADYGRLAARWNPQQWDVEQWLDLAQQAGMSYAVLTTKHHDGFCLFHSAHTDFHVGNTPYQRDIVAQWCDALRRRGMRVGLYYSVVDWHHPAYPNCGRHHELDGPQPGDRQDPAAYLEYLRAQVRELCTNYGRIDCLWWDLNVAELDDPSVHDMVKQLQPSCILNGRGPGPADFSTPERHYEAHAERAFTTPTEACQSVGAQSWGYRRDESYFTARHLMNHIAATHAMGGRYLLNIGPDGEGQVPERAVDLLRRIGSWRECVAEAWAGEPVVGLCEDPSIYCTRQGDAWYLHVPADLSSDELICKPITNAPIEAVLLNTGQAVAWATDMLPAHHDGQRGYLRLRGLPAETADEPLVIRLRFADGPELDQQAGGDERLAW
ncbi:MAG: alpha-L-fucosidase [Planctomycetota bacterium]|jgi:alpha-L-fucosidase|nr:alpha-L-fucosidase [Planctomycetota bacterium]